MTDDEVMTELTSIYKGGWMLPADEVKYQKVLTFYDDMGFLDHTQMNIATMIYRKYV